MGLGAHISPPPYLTEHFGCPKYLAFTVYASSNIGERVAGVLLRRT